MPSRIIREGINSSHRINELSPMAELFYRRLMTVADDFGRFYASPATLIGACWPTCPERVTKGQILEWLKECSSGDDPLVILYDVKGCSYLEISNFGQQKRSKSKFPERLSVAKQMLSTCEAPDNHLLSNCEANAQPSRIRISESYSKSEPGRLVEMPKVSGEEEPLERMYARHPLAKRRERVLAENAMCEAVVSGADPREIEEVHRMMCESEVWLFKDGITRSVPTLAEWLNDKGWKYPPKARDSPKFYDPALETYRDPFAGMVQE